MSMVYSEIQGLRMPVSKLVYGCAGGIMSREKECLTLLNETLENGINFFDTARIYGDSEETLGKWINKEKNRESITLLTKGCHPRPESPDIDRVTPKDIDEDIDISLKKLQTDYVDIYLLHRDDVSVPVEVLVDALEKQKRVGKTLIYGVSNWTVERFKEASSYAKKQGYEGFKIFSPNYSLAEQVNDPWQTGSEAISIGGSSQVAARQYLCDNKVPVVAYSSLARGLFSGKFSAGNPDKASDGMDIYALRGFYSEENIAKLARVERLATDKGVTVPEIALAYLLSQEINVFPIVSYSTMEHMKDNLKAADIHLSKSELDYLDNGK